VPVGDLADGGMLVGHFEGEPVLLARRGEEFFAVGAVCTHYSGPLVDGVIVGNEVRCPWHHACFDLRTGEAVRAPALNGIACWTTERRGDTVVVTGRKETHPERVTPPPNLRSVGIVGAGAAGNAAAEMLRRRGFEGSITMIGAAPTLPVDRPNLSKDYLAGNAPEEWIPLRPPDFYAEQRIDVLTGRRVTELERRTRELKLDDGTRRAFDAVLLATGASPVRLPIPGADGPHVHYLRSLADSRAIIAEAESGKRAAVIGASFIGLEVAAALRARDIDVTVIAPDSVPLARVLGPDIGAFVQRLHESHGVKFRLGVTPKALQPDTVLLSDGSMVPYDFVVLGVGVLPNVAVAESAKLELNNGIVVDEMLRTSAAGIFAAGDVARWPDRLSGRHLRVEHWVVAERQGQVAAENIIGMRKPYRDVPFFWSVHYDLIIAYVGDAPDWEAIEIRGNLDERQAIAAFRKGGRIAAVATVFMDRESLLAEAAMERGDFEELERIVRG
jgi:NADPH-dependent 2,4-dienoyl-CoA reductase/sulfur reductase-like enzyme/nitrite reductase/ring-hydroxylating ferredoxin subunit